jgi:uncharacterized protein (TIGR03086 family)
MTTEHPDLGPAAARLAGIIANIPDDALGAPTPCADYTVADLLDHVAGAAVAFRAAAIKQPLDAPSNVDGRNLAPDWRTRIPTDLSALVDPWRASEAWEGMTRVGGIDLPASIAGVVALDELVIHGWDLAVANGQDGRCDVPGLDAVYETVQSFRAGGLDGIFGPEVAVAPDAPLFDRILGVTGRNPAWRARCSALTGC